MVGASYRCEKVVRRRRGVNFGTRTGCIVTSDVEVGSIFHEYRAVRNDELAGNDRVIEQKRGIKLNTEGV